MNTYRPGVLLDHLRGEFRDLQYTPLSGTRGEFATADGTLRFQADEHVERHFLMHIVSARFQLALPATANGDARVKVRHRGTFRREGVEYQTAAKALTERLAADRELSAALLPLDFTQLEIQLGTTGGRLCLQHYGASEVVGRFPAIRRYIPLGSQQRQALMNAFIAFARALAPQDKGDS